LELATISLFSEFTQGNLKDDLWGLNRLDFLVEAHEVVTYNPLSRILVSLKVNSKSSFD
jgi:hypothetical protein